MVLDLVVLGILFVSAAVAFMRGFVREIFTIGSLAGAGIATLMFGPNLKPMVHDWIIDPAAKTPQKLFDLIPYEMLVPVIAFAIVFCASLVVFTIITHLVSKGVHSVGLGPVDRSLGVVFGLIRGVILIGLMGVVMNFVLSDEQRETYFGDSRTYPMVTYSADLMQALMPGREVIEKVAKKDINATLDAAKPGTEALEPGQAGRTAKGDQSSSVGKAVADSLRRRAADTLAPKDAETQQRPRTQGHFND
ncbi:MAG: CvpA family protein [Rhodospirillales bacterium]|nr:CvpA family protein [Alphaproteobacteria bacterium]MCB9986741.1 CvpA family protein [Rhodospirillales bacterium]USO08491.1 MAG: CvpA family protein [Rhodospirillales bacterium]